MAHGACRGPYTTQITLSALFQNLLGFQAVWLKFAFFSDAGTSNFPTIQVQLLKKAQLEKNKSLQSSLSQKQILGQKTLSRQNIYKAFVVYKRQHIWKNKRLVYTIIYTGISFIVCYLTGTCLIVPVVFLWLEITGCGCYVEPYSDPICLSIHFHTIWHNIWAIRLSNSFIKTVIH